MAERRCAIPIDGQAMAAARRRCVGAAGLEARERTGLSSGDPRGCAPVLDRLARGPS